MPPEFENYFAELADRIRDIETSVRGIPELSKKVGVMGDKVERVRVIVEGVDGDEGMKKAVGDVQSDVAAIKLAQNDERVIRDYRAPLKNRIITLAFSVFAAVTGGVFLGVTMFYVMRVLERS